MDTTLGGAPPPMVFPGGIAGGPNPANGMRIPPPPPGIANATGMPADQFAAANEKISQAATELPTPQAAMAWAQSNIPGIAAASPQQQQSLFDTYTKTRSGHGLVPDAVNSALPASVTGTPPTAPAGGAPSAPQPQAPPAQPGGYVPPPPAEYNPPAPSATYHAPTLQTPDLQTAKPTQAEYHPPKRGLEYLAAGLALLFPGAPIAQAAAGFAGGLGVGANQRYARDEHAAQEKYQQDRDAAATSNQQAILKANTTNQGLTAQAQADFEAGRAVDVAAGKKYDVQYKQTDEHRRELIDQGRNPNTGEPVPIPPQLQRILPPGTKRAVTPTDYAKHYADLGRFYRSIGANSLATQAEAEAGNYNRLAIDEANNARAMWQTTQQVGARLQAAAITAATAAASQAGAESRFERREDDRFMADVMRDQRNLTNQERSTYRTQAGQYMTQFRTAFTKDFLLSPGKDPQGNALPAPLAGQQAMLHALIRNIDKSADPYGTAQWMSQWYTDPRLQDLVLTYGQAGEARLKSMGRPIGNFVPPVNLPKGLAERLAPLGQGVQSMVYSKLLSGQSLDQLQTEIAGSANPDKQVILDALSGKKTPAPKAAIPQQNLMPDTKTTFGAIGQGML